MNRIWTGKVEKGRLKLDLEQEYEISILFYEGKDIELVLRERKYDRSNQQNKYYWGVVIQMIADEIGESPQNVHEMMKACFNKQRLVITVKGKQYQKEIVKSTTGLSTSEFEDYQRKIREWASSFLRLYIPLPNEIEL